MRPLIRIKILFFSCRAFTGFSRHFPVLVRSEAQITPSQGVAPRFKVLDGSDSRPRRCIAVEQEESAGTGTSQRLICFDCLSMENRLEGGTDKNFARGGKPDAEETFKWMQRPSCFEEGGLREVCSLRQGGGPTNGYYRTWFRAYRVTAGHLPLFPFRVIARKSCRGLCPRVSPKPQCSRGFLGGEPSARERVLLPGAISRRTLTSSRPRLSGLSKNSSDWLRQLCGAVVAARTVTVIQRGRVARGDHSELPSNLRRGNRNRTFCPPESRYRY